ncbi:MAG: hypothetical protein KFF49_06655, partial [Bacteroidales bacterium]|nr:hypothetical protein [Bacteroidales bacterium]
MKLIKLFATSFVFLLMLPYTGAAQENIIEIKQARLYREKKTALDYLSDDKIIIKFGEISDKIWSYAELGLQEFRSSALLIATLEEEGFTVERDVAGMPTCFTASWGEGRPVIGV